MNLVLISFVLEFVFFLLKNFNAGGLDKKLNFYQKLDPKSTMVEEALNP